MLLPDQVTPLQSTTTPGLVETVWMGIVFLKPLVLHMVRGYALRTILNQRQQLDHEQEVRQEKQGHHILSGNSDLPAPIASASTVEGFKTEAEIRRLRLRVPTWPRLVVGVWFLLKALVDVTQLSPLLHYSPVAEKLELAVSLLQGLAGLYILYRKSTHLTQWLFSTICVTTLYTQVTFSIRTWNPNMTKLDPPTKSLLNEEHASETELVFFHVMSIIMANIFFVMRLWVCWRLVVDLKARDARVARAKEQSRERGCAEKQQQGSLDGVVTDKPVNHSHS
ncbi:hypothetical protein BGZ96_002925 [Linnemannia gamsii]|uniref:Uncharacterized protein n=1 Tax=Linnemannia gamsii TaxID=64522 RepID=A0ABQ7JJV9_9FUNG|nr:hypothetical protein BGZ96_002925 [Linnemannia gamsii]